MRSPVGKKDWLFVNNLPNLKGQSTYHLLSNTGCASVWPVGWYVILFLVSPADARCPAMQWKVFEHVGK